MIPVRRNPHGVLEESEKNCLLVLLSFRISTNQLEFSGIVIAEHKISAFADSKALSRINNCGRVNDHLWPRIECCLLACFEDDRIVY